MTETAKRKILTPAEMFAADDTTYAEVEAWGGLVRLGSLDAKTMLDFVSDNKGPAQKTAGIRLLIQSLVDADGNRIGQMSMMEAFGKKNARTINKMADEILKLNGLATAGLDLVVPLRDAGTDPKKLAKLVSDLRTFATAIEEAGTDPKKLHDALDAVVKQDRDDAKNGSSEAV